MLVSGCTHKLAKYHQNCAYIFRYIERYVKITNLVDLVNS